MILKDIMRKDVVTASPESSVKDIARKMKDKNVGCVLITEGGSLRGILTDRDIACIAVAEGKDPNTTKASEIMHKNPVHTSSSIDILEASRIMVEKRIRRLPIQSNGRLEGIVTISDLAPVLKKEVDNFFSVEAAASQH